LEINEATNKKNDALPINFGSHQSLHFAILRFDTVPQSSPKKTKARSNESKDFDSGVDLPAYAGLLSKCLKAIG